MLTSNSTDNHLVKVAVQMENKDGLLTALDQKKSLSSIIQEFLELWNINESKNDYILQKEGQDLIYLTEKNRYDIKDGTMLRMTLSPSKQIDVFFNQIKNGNLNQNQIKLLYKDLSKNCRNKLFATEFIKKDGLKFLLKTIEQFTINDLEIIDLALESFIEIQEHGIASWDCIEVKFVEKIINFVNCGSSQYNKKVLLNSLIILENIITFLNFNKLIESSITLPNLILHVQNCDDELDTTIHHNCIALINALFLKSNLFIKKSISKTLSSKQYRTVILNSIVNKKNEIGSEMSHQLYVLQTNMLSLNEEKLKFTNEQEVNEKIKKICKLAFDNELNFLRESNQRHRFKQNNLNDQHYEYNHEDYSKMGFINCDNPSLDFCQLPGILTLDLVYYFASNYTDSFIKIVLENCSRSDKEHECPFIRSAIEITKFLINLLKIDEQATDEGKEFYSFFFTHDYPLEELFCICVPLLNKTWKEMRATKQDFDKVFSVLKQQLIEAFKNKEDTMNFETLKKRLSSLNYNEIMNIWQKEKLTKEEWENKTQSISELKLILKPEILDIIKQQRIQFLTEGTKFVKYTSKGQRLKDKFWYCRLSNKSKTLFYGDCNEEQIPSIENLPKKLPIMHIKYLVTGKECPHMKDIKSKKSTFQLAFSLLTESENEILNFVAPDEKTFHYWIDGINALLGQEMLSEETLQDLDMLLSLEIKLKLLETEGFHIPNLPPKVPELITNLNFNYES